ncbi:hypothetical protein B0H65DRAFT_19127 [Neurospora tetraspora]|uniref:Secreted protein n=1 Tax=Neurospora tetraspora TaxID=94610 RepID=A0AAE0JN35_9PEZI|nr:hypothetical protein B0H65DRAFT_19127 [Neurospora tetraspora]
MLIGQPIIWVSFHLRWCGLAVAEGASPVAPALVATTREKSLQSHFGSFGPLGERGACLALRAFHLRRVKPAFYSLRLAAVPGIYRLSTSLRLPKPSPSSIPSPRCQVGSRSKMRTIRPSDPSSELCLHLHSLLAPDSARVCFTTHRLSHSSSFTPRSSS